MKRSDYRRALDGIKLSDDFRAEMERKLSQPAQSSIEMHDYSDKVDHVERVPKHTWRNFAATAAAFVIVGGTAGGIAYRLHNMPDNRHEITEGMIETPFGSFDGFTLWMCEYSWGEMPEIAVDTFVNWLDSNNWEKVDLDSEDWEGVDIKRIYCGDGVTLHGIGGDEQILYFSTFGCAVESKDGEYSLYTFDGGDYTNWYDETDHSESKWWSYYSLERDLVYLAPYFDLTDVDLDNTFQDLTDECESYIKDELLANADSFVRLDEQETADRTAMLMNDQNIPYSGDLYSFHWAIGFSDDDVISVFYYNNPAEAPEGYPYNAAYYKAPEGLCAKMQSAIQNRLPGANNCPLEKHSGFTSALASATAISETETIALTEQEAEEFANWTDTLNWSIETEEYKDSENFISFSLDDERLYFFDNGYVCYNTIGTAKYYLMSGSEYTAAYNRLCEIKGISSEPVDPQTLINRVISDVQLAYLCEDDLVTGKYSANIPYSCKDDDLSWLRDSLLEEDWDTYDCGGAQPLLDCQYLIISNNTESLYVYADGTMYSPRSNCAYKCDPIEDVFVTICENIVNDPFSAALYRLAYPEQTYTTCEGSISYLGTMVHYNVSPYDGETQYTVEGTGYEWSADGHYYAQLSGDGYAAEAFIYGGLDMFAEHGEKLTELDPKAETVTDSAGRPTVCNYTSGYECRLSQKMMKDLAISLLYSYGTMPDSSVTAEAKDGVYTLTLKNTSYDIVVGIDSRGTVVRLYEAIMDYSTNETEVDYDYTFEPVYDSTAFHMPQLKSDLSSYAEDCLNDYIEKSVSDQ